MPTPEYFRQAIMTWLDRANEEELIEVLEVIQAQLTRRRIRDPRSAVAASQDRQQEPHR